jgi:hypothetical protein
MRLSSPVYVTLVLVLLSALPASAQPAATKPAWGVEVGGGVAYLTVPKGTSRSMGGDISGGLFVNVPFISVYRLQPELRFDHRQSDVRGTTRKFDYLDIPILVHIKIFKGLFMNEGPAFHVPLRARVESAGQETDVKSNTRADISLVMGVGVKAGNKVRVEGRWDTGIKATQKTVPSGDVTTRHRSITGVISIDLSKK